MRQLVEDDPAAAAVAGSGLDSGSGARRCWRRGHHHGYRLAGSSGAHSKNDASLEGWHGRGLHAPAAQEQAKLSAIGKLVQNYSSLISMITISGGVQLLLIGLLGDYIGKTYCETKQCVWCAMRCSSES